jgi:DNA-binding winged helix-turn-helix (wHTH) protein/tetratricopeptide (TPR) repeat protein
MIYIFGEYQLDTDLCELRCGREIRHVEPQVFDVLVHLVANRDRLVTREELLDAVWGHRFITLASLSSRLKAARQAIGDDGKEQHAIRTVRGRGFRFVAPVIVSGTPSSAAGESGATVSSGGPAPDTAARSAEARTRAGQGGIRRAPFQAADSDIQRGESPARTERHVQRPPTGVELLTARSADLGRLDMVLDLAMAGRRQIVFITGEPGIGKSTLAGAFIARLPDGVLEASGQCLEQRGPGEPYLPFLDAIGRLCRGSRGTEVIHHLETCAPSWLAQMPGLASQEQLEAARIRSLGATRERMLREMVEALEVITRDTPLVLLVEDLHWSDPSSLDLIAWIAQRHDPARLLLLVTLRRNDADTHLRDTIVQVMRGGHCTEIDLVRWSESDLGKYCAARFPGNPFPEPLLRLAHQRTEGNPLFVESLLEGWIESGKVVTENGDWRVTASIEELASGIPGSLRVLVDQRIDRLPSAEISLLEVASVVGADFASALVAAAAEVDEEEVESCCQELARRGRIVQENGIDDWPDGTLTARFAFAHHLFQEALYARISPARRTRLHAKIATRLEGALGPDCGEQASELAHHFRLGRSYERAIPYLALAAEQAFNRSAHREAVAYLESALRLLQGSTPLADAPRMELRLQRMLGPALIHTRGWSDPAAERAYLRARELAQQLGDYTQLARVLYGLAYLHEIRGDFSTSQALLEERIRLETSLEAPQSLLESHELLSCSLFHQGNFAGALRNATAAIHVADRGTDDPVLVGFGDNPGVASYHWEGLALWFLGKPDQALQSLHKAIELCGEQQLIYMHAASQAQLSRFHQLCRRVAPSLEHSRAALDIAERQGYPYHRAIALTLHGWGRVRLGEIGDGLDEIRLGLAMQDAAGADMERPYGLGLLADSLLHAGDPTEGLRAVDEGLDVIQRRARAFFWEAELHRLRGELSLLTSDHEAANREFRRAIDIARRQGSPALELRAATSLARLEAATSTSADVRQLLSRIYDRFTEGFETPDLMDARGILTQPPPLPAQSLS